MPCDYATKEAENFVKMCFKMQEKFQEGTLDREEIFKLGLYAQHFLPVFNAVGFFSLDKTAISAFIGTVATYFIVVVQFNGAVGWEIIGD